MMTSPGSWMTIAAGALAAQLPGVFLLQGQLAPTRAAWGWSANSAKCSYRGDGSCAEGNVLAGGTCTVECASGVPSTTSISCPATTGVAGSNGDSGWWGVCQPGKGACDSQLQIGTDVTYNQRGHSGGHDDGPSHNKRSGSHDHDRSGGRGGCPRYHDGVSPSGRGGASQSRRTTPIFRGAL